MKFIAPTLFSLVFGTFAHAQDPITFEWIQNKISSEKLSTLEDVIKSLPESQRSQYVLMYRSRSLQEATFQSPRVIMFGPDASLIIAFNGEPLHRGYNQLELIQFRSETKKFEFREIDFSSGAPKISEANPSKCLRCHQSLSRKDIDPRPNWEPYSMWPGAYGSDAGRLGTDLLKNERVTSLPEKFEYLKNLMVDSTREPEELVKFRSSMGKRARYDQLIPDRDYTSAGSYFDPLYAPTLFTHHVSKLNFQRVARIIMNTPDYDRYRYAIFATLYNKILLPEPLMAWHTARYTASDYRDNNRLENLEFIMHPRGIDTSDWFMDFYTEGRLAFSERYGTPSHPDEEFKTALRAADPKVNDVYPGVIEDISFKALEGFLPTISF